MSPAPDRTLTDTQQVIADLRRQLGDRTAERDEALATRDEAERKRAERTAERDEALEQQTAATEVLQIINSSPGDLAPVFDAILARALNLCGAAFGYMLSCDGEAFRRVASRGSSPALDAALPPPGPTPGSLAERFVRGEDIICSANLVEDNAYRVGAPAARALVDVGGVRSYAAVALRRGARLLGIIAIYRREVRPFSNKQITLLQNFAAQAVIAMENARLLTGTREALEQQTATAEVLQVINSSPGDLTPVFDAILEKAHSLCGVNSGALEIWDGERLRALATRGLHASFEELVRGGYQPGPNDLHWQLLDGARFVHIADQAALDEPMHQKAVELGGFRTFLGVALRKENTLLGRIVAARQEVRPFAEKEIALLQNFAAQAVIAMENARLINETREALEQQTATAKVLQVINSSPGDLAPVFDAMLEKAIRLCEASHGNLYIFDGDALHTVAARGDARLVEWLRKLGGFRPTRDQPIGRLLAGEPVVHGADATEEKAYSSQPMFREFVDLGGIRSSLAVALRRDHDILGVITLYRQEVRPFSDKQIALLQNFAAQAVIAMENARLLTETREALEQQTATAEVLQVINSSPGELTPVFDAMLERATRLCEASFGLMNTYDGEHFRAGAAHRVPAALVEWSERNPLQFGPGTAPARIVGGENLVHTADLTATEAYQRGDPSRRALVDLGGARSHLIAALRKDGALLGTIAVYRQEVRPFSDKQIALLQNFAAQAVIAMDNARLITETREALEQQTATAEVLGVINSSLGDLKPVFEAILDKAHSLCGVEYGVLLTYDGEFFWPVAMRGAPPSLESRNGFRPSSGFQGLLRGERLLHIHDMAEVAAQRPDEPVYRDLFESGGIRTQLAVPLRKDGGLLGIIIANRREVRAFSDKQIALLENFAAQAVIAIENARLLAETREALEQQTATAEVLQVINSSPGDLVPVFEAVVEKAMRLCEATNGYLFTYDGDRFRPAAIHGDPRLVEWHRQLGPFQPAANTGLERIRRGERLVHIPDVREVDVFRTVPEPRQAAEISGFRSALTVALRRDEVLLGALGVYRREVHPFSDKQIALLQNFAAQAGIAMENARLIGELRERTSDLEESLKYQTATSDVLQVISRSTFDLQRVLDTLVETAASLCDADMALSFRREGELWRLVTSVGFPAEYVEHLQALGAVPTDAESPLVGWRCIREARPVHIHDSLAIPGYPEESTARTALGVPLLREGEVIGNIVVARQRVEPFKERQIELVRTFADQAVIATENARLLGELRQRTEEVAELNRGLEARVAEQVEELGRVGRLKRFLAPQLAELIVSQGDEKILEGHRREIVVVFCDLRGYTAFTETAEPEEVLDFLREYHGALGPLVSQFEGTLDQFSGDGIMVFFNDPVPIPDPAERAVKMAVAMREAAGSLIAVWRERGRDLGFGAGIAQGYATLGQIGFSERSGYTAIGTVCNVAARLCAEAKDGQILLSQRINAELKGSIATEQIGALALKGLTQPVLAYNVPLVGGQAAFRVIEGGAPSA